MPEYPKWVTLEAIGDSWPGELTSSRQYGQFKSGWSDSMSKLGNEIERLLGRNDTVWDADVRIGLAVLSSDLRLDGRLRAGGKPWHVGMLVRFTTPMGELRFASDQYVTQAHNLRAVALTLEALRAVDRWGATHGREYSGFLAIESGIALGSSRPFHDRASAIEWLRELVGGHSAASPATLIREAQRTHHPDRGGDASIMADVNAAAALIEGGTN